MKKRILIVEDDKKTTQSLRQAMEAEGFEVVVAADGMEALRILESQVVDVIASDVNMPRMDGYELAKTVKSTLKTKNLPFVLYSSREATREDVELAARVAVDKYVEGTSTKAVVDEVIHQIQKATK